MTVAARAHRHAARMRPLQRHSRGRWCSRGVAECGWWFIACPCARRPPQHGSDASIDGAQTSGYTTPRTSSCSSCSPRAGLVRRAVLFLIKVRKYVRELLADCVRRIGRSRCCRRSAWSSGIKAVEKHLPRRLRRNRSRRGSAARTCQWPPRRQHLHPGRCVNRIIWPWPSRTDVITSSCGDRAWT